MDETKIRVTVTAKGVPGFSKDPVDMELPPGSTVVTILDRVLAVKAASTGAVQPTSFRNVIATLNGRYVPASEVEKRSLADGDEVTVMPLVVGG